MKKTIIAGAAASAVLAAMPVLGVFAAPTEPTVANDPDSIVDTLNITINATCTWSRTLAATGSGVTADGDNSLTAIMTTGQQLADFGTSTLNVKCNNSKGYQITAEMTDLTGYTATNKSTANGEKIEYASSLAAGKWTATLSDDTSTSKSITGDGSEIVNTTSGDNMTSGSTYKITYGVYTGTEQGAGFYTGTATYELTQNS